MPGNIRKIVKKAYYDFAIFHVEEVHVEDQIVYLVYVQDERTFKMITVNDDGIQDVETYDRTL